MYCSILLSGTMKLLSLINSFSLICTGSLEMVHSKKQANGLNQRTSARLSLLSHISGKAGRFSNDFIKMRLICACYTCTAEAGNASSPSKRSFPMKRTLLIPTLIGFALLLSACGSAATLAVPTAAAPTPALPASIAPTTAAASPATLPAAVVPSPAAHLRRSYPCSTHIRGTHWSGYR